MTHGFSAEQKNNEPLKTALSAVYDWGYTSEIERVRDLYLRSLDRQWIAVRELPWEDGVDRNAFERSFNMWGVGLQQTKFWRSLSPAVRWEVSRQAMAWILSNYLHGEQGALMVASQLVNAVPHMDAKFYAASQTLDEARHVEVFSRYIQILGEVRPVAQSVKALLDTTLTHDNWLFKCVGMQIVVEGLALYSFRDMRDNTAEPLLRRLLTYVARDEARHTAFGIQYLSEVIPRLADTERAELEDFAFEASRSLIDSRSGATLEGELLQIWQNVGVDPSDVLAAMSEEQDSHREAVGRMGGRIGPISGFVVPTLARIGLLSDRLREHYRNLFERLEIMVPPKTPGGRASNPIDDLVAIPSDLDAWVTHEEIVKTN
jgi:P-aminobenzoate N-oxygenase AurF